MDPHIVLYTEVDAQCDKLYGRARLVKRWLLQVLTTVQFVTLSTQTLSC